MKDLRRLVRLARGNREFPSRVPSISSRRGITHTRARVIYRHRRLHDRRSLPPALSSENAYSFAAGRRVLSRDMRVQLPHTAPSLPPSPPLPSWAHRPREGRKETSETSNCRKEAETWKRGARARPTFVLFFIRLPARNHVRCIPFFSCIVASLFERFTSLLKLAKRN